MIRSVSYYTYVVFGVLFYTKHILASTPAKLNTEFTAILMECIKEYPITAADLQVLTNKDMPDNEASKCLFACAYKKTGTMDDDGNFSADGVLQLSKKYFEENDQIMKITKNYVETCVKVNEVPVSDGAKGCERAALVFKCSADILPKVEFF